MDAHLASKSHAWHLWKAHGRPHKKEACEVCGVVFAPNGMALHREASGHGAGVPPRFRCDACGHLSGDLDAAERHRRYLGHLLYSEKGVSEIWYYDLPNEAALFADS
ncbi:hypothetical protein [Demequina oxidasica]|uniref:hypothetical protein n=1 Tax=Demequina oxidasica TaxID=676199 RepID=UPI00128B451F|nr:hypothetical protein [Demequina oxidasica]